MTLATFTAAYITCALWSSSPEEPERIEWDSSQLAPETREKMEADCRSFWASHSDTIETHGTAADAGHDFWLTRCGHGAGFWDGDWPEPAGDALTVASEGFGNVELYAGDDGRIYA